MTDLRAEKSPPGYRISPSFSQYGLARAGLLASLKSDLSVAVGRVPVVSEAALVMWRVYADPRIGCDIIDVWRKTCF